MNTGNPDVFATEAIAAIQRQLDKGHRLITDGWGGDGPASACFGCALTLVAFDIHGSEAVIEAINAEDDDGDMEPTEDVIGGLVGLDGRRALDFAGGFDNGDHDGSMRGGWWRAGTTVHDHFVASGALPGEDDADEEDTEDDS